MTLTTYSAVSTVGSSERKTFDSFGTDKRTLLPMSSWNIFRENKTKRMKAEQEQVESNGDAGTTAGTDNQVSVETGVVRGEGVTKESADEETMRVESGSDEDDKYDILASIEQGTYENRRMLKSLVRRNKALEARLDEYDKLFSRLTEYLDTQLVNDARQHNKLLRMGIPVPFRSTHTNAAGLDHVPEHEADRWNSVAKGSRSSRPLYESNQPTCNVGLHRDI